MNFQDLRKANVERCEKVFHPLNSWSLTDWACAMAGEAGEACNIVKKIRRLEDELYRKNNKVAQPISEEYKEMLKKELGDVVCYVDLLAARAGINLEEAVVHKFNEVSDRMGSDIKL